MGRAGISAAGGGPGSIVFWTAAAILIGMAMVAGAAYVLNGRPADSPLGSPLPPRVVTPAGIESSGQTLGSPGAGVTIDVWEDYRCTYCYDFTTTSEPQLVDRYVKTGKARLVYHDLLTIDTHPPFGTESRDAANASLCARDQGEFWTYHDWLFANQSPHEDPGAFTLDRLVAIGKDAGLNMAAFEPCVRNGTHLANVKAEQAGAPSDATVTPSIFVNNKRCPNYTYDVVSAAIDTALKSAPSSSGSAAPSRS